MHSSQVAALSSQLTPVAEKLVVLLRTAQVAINPENLTPWYDRTSGQLCYGKNPRDPAMAVVRFGPPVQREGSGWTRELGEPQITGSAPVEAVRRDWRNSSSSAIQVSMDRSVAIAEGIQAVTADSASWNSSWGLGTSAKVTMGTKASAGLKAGPITGNAEISSSLELAINANYSGSSGGQHSDTRTEQRSTTTTRKVQQSFTVPPRTDFTATATYSREQWLIPYEDTLPVDVPFELPPLGLRYAAYFGKRVASSRYTGPKLKFRGQSLLAWLEGFFGEPPKGCDVFMPELNVHFATSQRDLDVCHAVLAVQKALSVQRTGAVVYSQASGFDLKTESTPV